MILFFIGLYFCAYSWIQFSAFPVFFNFNCVKIPLDCILKTKIFFNLIRYKPNEAFCALKIAVISEDDKATEYTIAVPILPLTALPDGSYGS